MYCDIVGKPLPVPPSFKEDGSEGTRVGYFCHSCGKAYPIRNDQVTADYSGPFANLVCSCGASVDGVYRKEESINAA